MSEKCPFCAAELDHMTSCMEGHPHGKETPLYKCGCFLDTNGDFVRPPECYDRQLAAKEAELSQLRGLLGEAVKWLDLLKGAVEVRNTFPGPLGPITLDGTNAFLAKAKMKEGVG